METLEVRCPDESQIIAIRNDGERAQRFKARFIEPGLVRYSDVGTVLVQKPALDAMSNSFEGMPVFNEEHKENGNDVFTSGRDDGHVTKVWYDSTDGWYWCEFWSSDPGTIRNCKSGKYSVSCAYDVKQWGAREGIHNNIPYEREVLAGAYNHLAIVPNPRYEGARIICNSNGGNMKLALPWKSKEPSEVRNTSEIDVENATLAIDGQDVPLKDCVTLWAAQNAQKKANDALAKLTDSDEITVDGHKVTIGELRNAHLKNQSDKRKNEEETEEEKKKRLAKEAADAKKENADDDDDEEKKKKKKEEDDKAKDSERKNALEIERKEKDANFNKVKELANARPGEFKEPEIKSMHEREAVGSLRYGSSK